MELGRRSLVASLGATVLVPHINNMVEAAPSVLPALHHKPEYIIIREESRIILDEFWFHQKELRERLGDAEYARMWKPSISHVGIKVQEMRDFSAARSLSRPYLSVNGLFRRLTASLDRLVGAGRLDIHLAREVELSIGGQADVAMQRQFTFNDASVMLLGQLPPHEHASAPAGVKPNAA